MSEAPAKPGRVYLTAWSLYLVMAIAGVVWVGWREGRVPANLFVDTGGWWVDLGLGIAAGTALVGLWEIARNLSWNARLLEERIGELLGPLGRSEAIALALISGFSEELFFRGAMQGSLGWIVATAVFTLLHLGPGPEYRPWTLFALAAGLGLAGLVIWRQNLLAPVVAHTLVNAVGLLRVVANHRSAEPPIVPGKRS